MSLVYRMEQGLMFPRRWMMPSLTKDMKVNKTIYLYKKIDFTKMILQTIVRQRLSYWQGDCVIL